MSERTRQRRIEMGAFGLSLAVVISVLAGLLFFEQPGLPEAPLVTARITGVERLADRMIVRYELVNQGTLGAESVRVRISTPRTGVPSEQVFAYLPVGTTRRGIATLYDVPAGEAPAARIMGYVLP